MKKFLVLMGILSISAFGGCKKGGTVSFCEGADNEGKGVKCGTVFMPGDMTIVFSAKEAFGTDSVTAKMYNINDVGGKSVMERPVKVNPDETTGRADIEMYDEGSFKLVIEKKGEIISEGMIEIIDSINSN
jgi:hypothetical protein